MRLCSSVVEQCLDKALVAGSNPAGGTKTTVCSSIDRALALGARGCEFESHQTDQFYHAAIAQAVEQWTENTCVVGSIPTRCAKHTCRDS